MKLHSIEGNKPSRGSNPVKSRIRDFLNGENNGSELFAALYGHVAREAIPERLRLSAFLPAQDKILVAVSAA
jgi:hypothetical protein